MTREEAHELLLKHVQNPKMLYHLYASEAVMKALASRLGRDMDKWGLAGLLHDIDIEITNADPHTHALKAVDILREAGLEEDLIDAVKMHNEYATGETITGLIYATALVYPDKKVAQVKPKSVIKRMKQSAFAASVKRENIMECEKIGIPLEEFVEISLNAMKGIAEKIGL